MSDELKFQQKYEQQVKENEELKTLINEYIEATSSFIDTYNSGMMAIEGILKNTKRLGKIDLDKLLEINAKMIKKSR